MRNLPKKWMKRCNTEVRDGKVIERAQYWGYFEQKGKWVNRMIHKLSSEESRNILIFCKLKE